MGNVSPIYLETSGTLIVFVKFYPDEKTAIREKLASGLLTDQTVVMTFQRLVEAFDDVDSEYNVRYRQLADALTEDGHIEVDEDAVTSGSDDPGDYIQAWLWVPDPEKEEADDE